MPKPENFESLTPDQKRQARLDAWINHEGIEFTDPGRRTPTGSGPGSSPTFSS